MSMDYREVGRPHSQGQWAQGVAIMDARATALQKLGLLPERFPQESSEQSVEPIRHSDKDRVALVKAGAKLIIPQGLSLQAQRGAGRLFWHIVDGGREFITLKPRPIEVAIFPDPAEFFVPGSFDKTKTDQERLLADDVQVLRERLGLENVTGILPEVSEATQVIFEHFDGLTDKDDRLFGPRYGFKYMRTNTPTNLSGSVVGSFLAVNGLYVYDFRAGRGDPSLGAARWVVPAQAVSGNR